MQKKLKIINISYEEAVERMTLAMLKEQNRDTYTYGDVVRAMLNCITYE